MITNKLYWVLLLFLAISWKSFSQSPTTTATIKIDGDEILISDNQSFPLWLKAGTTVELGTNTQFISIIEFIEEPVSGGSGYSLVYNKVILLRNLDTVPVGKVWKVEYKG